MPKLKDCECGCGERIWIGKTTHGVYRKFKHGHNRKGKLLQEIWIPNPKERTSRGRAAKLRKEKICDISNNLCLGRVETAHIDHNALNNELSNISRLCRAHHVALDNNRLQFNDLYSWTPVRRPKK